MEIEIEQGTGCRRSMQGAATVADVRQDSDAALDEYRQASVPGFRAGKAPVAVIEKRYHREIGDTVGKRAAARLLQESLYERDMQRVGPARFTAIDFDRETGLTFTVEFDVTPEIAIPDFKTFTPSGKAPDDATRKDDLSEYLIGSTTFDLPESLVEQEMEFATHPGQESETDQARCDAERRVKLLLILQAIARREGIEVDDRDLDARIAAMAEASGTSVRALQTDLEQKNGLDRLKLFLLAEHTMDYVLGTEG